MRLPREIQSGVQSQGLQNPGDELTAQRYRQQAINQGANVVHHMERVDEDSRVSQETADYMLKMEKGQAALLGTQRLQIKDEDGVDNPMLDGINYEDDGSGSVNASEVMDQIFDKMESDLSSDALSRIRTKKGKSDFEGTVLRARAAAAGNVAKQALTWGNQEKAARFDAGFENAQEFPDRQEAQELAMGIADKAYTSGVWTEPQYLENVERMLQKTDVDHYVRELNATDDTADLAVLSQQLLTEENNLTTEQKVSLSGTITTAITRIDRENLAASTLARTRRSQAKSKEISSMLLKNGPMDASDLDSQIAGLEITEYRAVVTLNRSLETKQQTDVKEGNFSDAMVSVYQLTKDSALPFSTRRMSAMNAVTERLESDDPEFMITGAQAITLWAQIDDMQELAVNSQVYQDVEESMFRLITGGSSLQFGVNNTGAEKINIDRALTSMRQAAREEGPGFDAEEWWSSNQGKYLGATYRANLKSLVERSHTRYIVKSGDVFQLEASVDKVFMDKSLTVDERMMIIDKLDALARVSVDD